MNRDSLDYIERMSARTASIENKIRHWNHVLDRHIKGDPQFLLTDEQYDLIERHIEKLEAQLIDCQDQIELWILQS